ncbi:MAG: T9SS type A sorting domain-containing protein [Cyclobacteriaceae bacterium]|nr:T9SS type A sorting domain-containing protein [Cyclobacteriaceae bacterium]
MKEFLLAFLVVMHTSGVVAQTSLLFPVDTLIKNGTVHDRINLVFVSEGYQVEELPKFKDDALNITHKIFSQTPFKEYHNYFNVFAIMVPSAESGVNHQQLYKDTNPNCAQMPASVVDNFFKSRFDQGIHHALSIGDLWLLLYVLAESFPYYDQVIVLTNTTYYGGGGSAGGGTISTTTVNEASGWVALHELGHSFGGLADEYWSGFDQESPNLTQENSVSKVRWRNWLNTNGIGIYSIPGSADGWYRPHQNCMMQVPGFDFCSVCSEAITEKIHSLISPVTNVEPPGGALLNVGTEDVVLKLTTIQPIPNTLRIVWKLNNKIIGKNTSSIAIPPEQLDDGYLKVVKVEVIDTTHLTRSVNHSTGHLYIYQWVIDGLVTSVENEEIKFEVIVWPNPTHGNLNVAFDLEKQTEVEIKILDVNGGPIAKTVAGNYPAGRHELGYNIDKKGIFFVVVIFDGTPISSKIIGQ